MVSGIHNTSTSPDRYGVLTWILAFSASSTVLLIGPITQHVTINWLSSTSLRLTTTPLKSVSLDKLTVLSPTGPLTTGMFRSSTDFSLPQAPQSTMAGTRFPLANCGSPSWILALKLHPVSATPALPSGAASRVSTTRTPADHACLAKTAYCLPISVSDSSF